MDNSNMKSGSSEITRVLQQMNQEGGFPISVLTDSQGLPIASAAQKGMNADRQSAVVAFIQKTATQVSKQLGLSGSEEISLLDSEGMHLICRFFKVYEYDLILSVMISHRNTSYRRITSNAIRRIAEIWSEYWEQK
jgi:predicted regulator of Ras-like GTPase activity (Roadblock/LC7/MglB family)